MARKKYMFPSPRGDMLHRESVFTDHSISVSVPLQGYTASMYITCWLKRYEVSVPLRGYAASKDMRYDYS